VDAGRVKEAGDLAEPRGRHVAADLEPTVGGLLDPQAVDPRHAPE
jgi:hypothetical protein